MYLKTTTDSRTVIERAIADIIDAAPAVRLLVRRHGESWTLIGQVLTEKDADMVIPEPVD